MATSPVTLDFSKAQPISQPVTLDFSKAQPIANATPKHGLLDRLQSSFDAQTKTSPSEPLVQTGIKSVISGIGTPFVHPMDTLSGLGHMIAHPIDQAHQEVNQLYDDKAAGGAGYAATKMAGQAFGGIALGDIGGSVLKAAIPKAIPIVGKAATAMGDTAQDAGTGLMNKTVGTLKSDFKRGANPARGYLETGNGPSLSMHSIADKAATALDETGKKLGTAYQQADATGIKIPVDTVAQEMAKPLQKAIDLETGPGGTGNVAAIHSYIQQFAPAFDKAAQNGGFTPSELFEMKRAIAQNTNWSDPAQFSLKSVRQQQAGALSGILSDAVPETKALNQTYQDLTKLEARAQERANTGSRPLTAHIYKAGMTAVGALAGGMEGNALVGAAAGTLMDSVPVKTSLATGLFRGGRALSRFGEGLAPADGASVEGVAPNDLGSNGANNKPGNPQLAPPDAATILRNKIKGRLKPKN